MPRMRVADSKVRSSIKKFLERMKAMDADIPEELAEDALEMAEEVSDALREEAEVTEDEDADVLEITKDSEEQLEAKIEDTMMKVLRRSGLIKDSSVSALDELEKKLADACNCGEMEDADADVIDADGEEEVTVDPDKMKDSAASMRKLIRDMKPIIASIPSASARRRLTDSIVRMAGMAANDGQYSQVLKTAKSAAADSAIKGKKKIADADTDFGMDVASRFNPHYKKEG